MNTSDSFFDAINRVQHLIEYVAQVFSTAPPAAKSHRYAHSNELHQ
jgi:hypothetical protein